MKGVEMSYIAMTLPFEIVPFDEMKKKQAEQYFNWYVDTLDLRISKLEKYINEEGGSFALDKTPESLIHLWEWFEPRIELCQKTEAEIEAEMKKAHPLLRYHILENPRKISTDTWVLAYDISAYFGEVIKENNPQIYWGLLTKPKRLYGVNRPQLLGFTGNIPVYAYGRIELCIWRSIEKADKMYLYNMYEVCLRMI